MRHFVLYRTLWLISLLPMSVLYVMSDIMYLFVSRLYRRRVVHENLVSCFPEKTNGEIREMEKAFYRQFCDYLVEVVKSFSISQSEMMKRVTFSGVEDVQRCFDEGHDYVFAYLGHYGNWEWLASVSYWMPFAHCTQIYHPLNNRTADSVFLQTRQRYGGECIAMNKTLRRLVELRRENRKVVVGCISDQLPKWNSIHHFSSFLNHETAVFTGVEQMSKKMNSAVFYAHVTRVSRGRYHCQMIPMFDNPRLLPDYQITDRYMQMLEADIKSDPSLWLWTHKRWRRTKEQWIERQKEKQ